MFFSFNIFMNRTYVFVIILRKYLLNIIKNKSFFINFFCKVHTSRSFFWKTINNANSKKILFEYLVVRTCITKLKLNKQRCNFFIKCIMVDDDLVLNIN